MVTTPQVRECECVCVGGGGGDGLEVGIVSWARRKRVGGNVWSLMSVLHGRVPGI